MYKRIKIGQEVSQEVFIANLPIRSLEILEEINNEHGVLGSNKTFEAAAAGRGQPFCFNKPRTDDSLLHHKLLNSLSSSDVE